MTNDVGVQSHRAPYNVHPDSEVRQILSPVPKGRHHGGSTGHLHVSASPGMSAAVCDVCVCFHVSHYKYVKDTVPHASTYLLCYPLITSLVLSAAIVSLTNVSLPHLTKREN